MRIRKHAKISPLLYASSSLKAGPLLQTHVCQLNQSPWDVMTFSPPSSPPPPFQMNGRDAPAENGSSDHRVSVAERELTRSEYPISTRKVEAADEDTPPPPVENEATIIYCCKTDGKSWQCRREAAEGNSLCEHHLSLVKSYNTNVAHNHAARKSVKPAAAEASRRPRPKKAPAASSSNPYEFYYYSGFGPRWGKRRGETDRKNSNGMPKNVEMQPVMIPSIGDEDFIFEDEDEDEDEEDEGEEARNNGKKRMRKPIKARSLKSLF
ncbi:uncharacterized protein LOC130998076 [Salvia miltiorrhiza]|uniref:uncharacterized protein LOC130998076 n=1 Tax=Salvia miltiorrhiza TaxID=226208 RepID=UPI0025ACD8CB|nr:uncharacterized protein LOC130998076 [Salvia miltiorrhiza]